MMKAAILILMFHYCVNAIPQCSDDIIDVNYDYYLKEISIEGSTNVHHFSFWYENQHSDLLDEQADIFNKPDSGMMDFNIPVHLFRGSIPAMRHDFLNLLRASEYPEIIVGIEKFVFDCMAAEAYPENLNLVVTLAGTKKAIHADYSTHFESNNRIVLSGVTKFLLSDFQLVPPEKALGLVRVQNEVFIKFDIVISNIQFSSNQT